MVRMLPGCTSTIAKTPQSYSQQLVMQKKTKIFDGESHYFGEDLV
jgi:hypothetical protein